MLLPAGERAVVAVEKVRDYLLSTSHPVGRFKAVFFRALGYASPQWEVLVADLLGHAAGGTVETTTPGSHGTKYEVHGTLKGPNGREADLISVWIVRAGEEFPRFVTAFPGERK